MWANKYNFDNIVCVGGFKTFALMLRVDVNEHRLIPYSPFYSHICLKIREMLVEIKMFVVRRLRQGCDQCSDKRYNWVAANDCGPNSSRNEEINIVSRYLVLLLDALGDRRLLHHALVRAPAEFLFLI